MNRDLAIRIIVSLTALFLLVVHLVRPDLQIDAISIGLLIVSILPWASSFVESLKAPGGWEIKLNEVNTKMEQFIDASSEATDSTGGERSQDLPLTDSQLSVLNALTKASVPLRSVSGIRKDTNLDSSEVNSILGTLVSGGLAAEIHGKKGIRWGITPTGRAYL